MSNQADISKAKTLRVSSSVAKALAFFEKNNANYVAVLEDKIFHGVLFKELLKGIDKEKTILEVRYILKDISIKTDYTLFDWLKLCSAYDITEIPLISDKNIYIKNISIEDVLAKHKHTSLSLELSTILVLNKDTKSFTFSQLSQIIEAHGARLLASYIVESNKDITQVVVKILHSGLNELLQSFRRYEYDIESYHEEDLHQETLKDNSNYLSKYLTV